MDNQHRHIKGYRELNSIEIARINEIKELGKKIQLMVESIGQVDNVDHRWLNIGTTQLQQGIMALVRSVAQPDSF